MLAPVMLFFGNNQSFRSYVWLELKIKFGPNPDPNHEEGDEEIPIDQFSFTSVEVVDPSQDEINFANLHNAKIFEGTTNNEMYTKYLTWREDNKSPLEL